jgi:hypothetical protein
MAYSAQTLDNADVRPEGFMVVVRPWTDSTTKATGAFVDLGHVFDPNPTVDQTTVDVFTSRDGTRELIKTLSTSILQTLEFSTYNVTDTAVWGLWKGVTTSTTANGTFAKNDVEQITCEAMVIYKSGEDGGLHRVAYYPKVDISGNGEGGGGGEEAKYLTFLMSVLADSTYTAVAGIDATTPAMPRGWEGLVDDTDLTAVMNLVAG